MESGRRSEVIMQEEDNDAAIGIGIGEGRGITTTSLRNLRETEGLSMNSKNLIISKDNKCQKGWSKRRALGYVIPRPVCPWAAGLSSPNLGST